MKQQIETNIQEALSKLRSDLKASWGYGPDIAKKFNTTTEEVYNVAHGRKKNPMILKALIDKAKSAATVQDPSLQLLTEYYQSGNAA